MSSSGVQEFRSSGVQEFRSSGRFGVEEDSSKVKSRVGEKSLRRTTTSTVRVRIRRQNFSRLGGAKVILATVTNADAMRAVSGVSQ
jgi:hypothetical protein